MARRSSVPETLGRAGYIRGRLFKHGSADVPVEQVSVCKLAVNLKAAKAMGVAVPDSKLLGAGEAITQVWGLQPMRRRVVTVQFDRPPRRAQFL